VRPLPRKGPTTGSLCALVRTSSYTSTAHGGVLSFGQFTYQSISKFNKDEIEEVGDLRIMSRVPG
jgi:hypothetical protein